MTGLVTAPLLSLMGLFESLIALRDPYIRVTHNHIMRRDVSWPGQPVERKVLLRRLIISAIAFTLAGYTASCAIRGLKLEVDSGELSPNSTPALVKAP